MTASDGPAGPGPKIRAVLAGLPVAAWLVAVELGLRTTSLSRLSRLLGVVVATEAAGSGAAPRPTPSVTARERRQLRMLSRLLAHWPFGSGPCLRQSLVAGRILHRHHPRLRLGAAPTEGGVLGHAWLELPGGASVGHPAGFPVLVGHG